MQPQEATMKPPMEKKKALGVILYVVLRSDIPVAKATIVSTNPSALLKVSKRSTVSKVQYYDKSSRREKGGGGASVGRCASVEDRRREEALSSRRRVWGRGGGGSAMRDNGRDQ
ncbi:hypothetical protein E2562_005268 [Oryza meyeriana var. granulata]|uniref:Transposase Tnp1/En/Spm-like domain-containing protein n=1 Tax=Oryza meyeriana var. granulata TaxID=110450 RepID=A0A6G1EEW3_9ORYZ|nr:hypothetical protein E2562_005268 [Oryza meyeriana var. granulata]